MTLLNNILIRLNSGKIGVKTANEKIIDLFSNNYIPNNGDIAGYIKDSHIKYNEQSFYEGAKWLRDEILKNQNYEPRNSNIKDNY